METHIILFVLFSCLTWTCLAQSNLTREELVHKLFLNYDSSIPPTFNEDEPVVNHIQLYILNIDSVSDSEMEYTVFMILRQKWVDHRLKYDKIDGLNALELDVKAMNNVWVPDLYFSNEKRAKVHDITVPNKLLHIYSDGQINYSMRLSVTLSCAMNLLKYPMDFQICSMEIESYGYTKDRLVYKWLDPPYELSASLSPPKFSLGDIQTSEGDKLQDGLQYTRLSLDMHFTRLSGYHLIQEYIPSGLIVMLSWVSFWISKDAVPARISIGLLSVLTMTTHSSSSRTKLPEVSYITAFDIWMSACMLFVFAALLEYALVNVYDRKYSRREKYIEEKEKCIERAIKHDLCSCFSCNERARLIDKVSRVSFPLVFTVFNIVYWSVYLTWQPVTVENR